MEDQNFILIKNEEVVSTRSSTCNKEKDSEDCRELLGEISSEMENLWRELNILEKRLENKKVSVLVVKSELNENEEVHCSGQGQEYIIKTNGLEERLVDSLVNYFENPNKHTDVLIKEEELEQQAKLLPKEEKTQKPYDFYFNNCFMITTFFADKERKLELAEGDIFNDIQEAWVEAIYTTVPRVISRVIAEAEVEKAGESNQQFECQ